MTTPIQLDHLDASRGFPGGTAVSHLTVYDWPTVDGLTGGSPHLHTASTEGYVVLRGEGELQTLSSAGYRAIPLGPGTLLWFTPGTVHRLVNRSGDLELVVVMQNAGLPESGDAVLTYPPDVLGDAEAYRRATQLPPSDGSQAGEHAVADAARTRRDLAIEGYLQLRERVEVEGPQALAPLHDAAAQLVRERSAGWHHLWARGPKAQAELTGRHLDALGRGDPGHLGEAAVYTTAPPADPRAAGMCGRLQVWDLDGAARLL